MGKLYRTAKGTAIDMEALRTANENAVAVGNMKVNAKGDVLKGGKVVQTAKERITPHYGAKKQVAKTSLKPPVKETKAEIKQERVATKEVPVAEPVKTVKTRKDGSTYEEIFHDDGTVETRELTAPTKKGRKTP